jgi:outer membrane protein
MRTTFTAFAAAQLAATAVPALAAEVKIAVISAPQLLRDAPQVQAADARFKGEFQRREDELKAEGKKLDDDIARFRREGDTMSPQQRTGAQNDLNTRRTNFEIKQRQFTEQAQVRNNELQREVLEQVNRAIVEVAKEKGIDVVVRDPAYAAEGFDITDEVLKKLATYPASKPAGADPKKKPKK